MKGLIGKKIGMATIFSDDGVVEPVTLIECGPCFVTQLKSVESDGYRSVQLGFGEVDTKKLSGGIRGHITKNNIPGLKVFREFRVTDDMEIKEGQKLTADVFENGDLVDVTGKSKGKGFQGAMKRHGFGGGPKTHGQSDRQRSPGSIGATTTPGRVLKGKKMPGRMGGDRVTVQNLTVAMVDADRNLLGIRGAVPGPIQGIVLINGSRKQ